MCGSRRESSPCLVCGATERTNTHFGSNVCVACASFFRRTVSCGIRFLCKEENACEITQNCKFTCRCCRFDKCIRAGMQKDLVQEKRDEAKLPKYVLESRKKGVKEVIRGYTTSKSLYSSDGSSSTRSCSIESVADSMPFLESSGSPEPSETSDFSSEYSDSETSAILGLSHEDLLQYYVKQVQTSSVQRKFDPPQDFIEQFRMSKEINDRLAFDLCTSCPGTDLLEKPDIEILFRYCSFASLWIDSAWVSAARNGNEQSSIGEDFPEDDHASSTLSNFVNHFQQTVGRDLSRIQLDVVEYAALKSFCIWKLGMLDFSLTLKTIAQEQYYGVTQALNCYYQDAKNMDSCEIATRLADIVLLLGPIFNSYKEMLHLYKTLFIPISIDNVLL